MEEKTKVPELEVPPEAPPGGAAEEKTYVPGDFVWGKLKNQHWWPGQVYDSSLASDSAKKVERKDSSCVLVVYFGNGLFAWCEASQLKPFEVEFGTLVSQRGGKGFVGAVTAALDEVRRCLEMEMGCGCVPVEARRGLERPEVVNGGVKEGVLVPKGRISGKSIVDGMLPAEFLQWYYGVACDASTANLFDSSLMRSWVTSFFRAVGRYAPLPEYYQHKVIDEEGVTVKTPRNMAVKGPRNAVSRSHKAKKQRSMAELIAETDIDVGGEDEGKEEEVVPSEKPKTTAKKSKRKRVEKIEEFNVDIDDGGGGDGGGGDGNGDEEGHGSVRRERKKSKYLSPPYTLMDSGTKSFNLPKLSGPLLYEEDYHVGLLSGTKPMVKCSNKNFVFDEKSASVEELLAELHLTKLDPMYLVENRYESVIRGFFDRFRSSVYLSGSNFEEYSKYLENPGGIDVNNLGSETSLFSQEGKPGGFCIVRGSEMDISEAGKKGISLDHEVNVVEETKIRSPGFDINIPLEASMKSPSLETNCLKEGVDSSEDNKSKKTRKRRFLGQEAIDLAQPKRKGRSRKNSIGGGEIIAAEETQSGGRAEAVSVGQEAVVLDNGNSLQKKRRRRKNKNKEMNSEDGTALLLSFANGGDMPSKDELISAFSKFGVLKESETGLLKDSGCARVVFARSSDADKALDSSKTNGDFVPGMASCLIQPHHGNSSSPPQTSSVPKPPLDFVKKSLEKMITTLNESAPQGEVASSASELKPEAREKLVDEMSGLLSKVNKLLKTSTTSSGSSGNGGGGNSVGGAS